MHPPQHDNDDSELVTEASPRVISGRRSLMKIGAALLGAPLIAGIARQSEAALSVTRPAGVENAVAAGRVKQLNDFTVDLRDVQILFVDLQSALTKGSQSIKPDAIAANAAVLAKIGRLLKIPMTFSVVPVAGKSGVLIPELVPFASEQNTFHRILAGSFTNQSMVAALAANRRQTLIIAGYATEVAVLQSALSAMAAGYTVQIPVDVIGSASARTESAAMRQMEMAGAIPTSVLSLAAFMAPNFSEEPGTTVLSLFSELRAGN